MQIRNEIIYYCIINFIPHFTEHVTLTFTLTLTNLSMPGLKFIHVSKRGSLRQEYPNIIQHHCVELDPREISSGPLCITCRDLNSTQFGMKYGCTVPLNWSNKRSGVHWYRLFMLSKVIHLLVPPSKRRLLTVIYDPRGCISKVYICRKMDWICSPCIN